jgi:hypothetical protein
MALIVSPIATICTRKFGTRISLFIGILFETAGLLGKALLYPNYYCLSWELLALELFWSGHDFFVLVS